MPRFELTIPPNTLESNPITQRVAVNQSEFNHEIILIPKNHAYLARLKINAGRGGTVIPTPDSNTKWLRGDGDTIVYNQHIQLDPPQYILEFIGWNEDDTYPHTFYLDFE